MPRNVAFRTVVRHLCRQGSDSSRTISGCPAEVMLTGWPRLCGAALPELTLGYVIAAALGRNNQAFISKGGQRSGCRVMPYLELLGDREDAWYAADQLRRLDASAQDRCQLLMQRHRRVMVEHPRSVPLSGIPLCVWVYPGAPQCTVD
jgi:hypothetical protein